MAPTPAAADTVQINYIQDPPHFNASTNTSTSTSSTKKTKKERKPYVASNKVKAQQAFVSKVGRTRPPVCQLLVIFK